MNGSRTLPVLGRAVHLLAVLFGLGALRLLARDRFHSRRVAAGLPQAGAAPAQTTMPAAA